jgi:hypothetical protein
MMRLKNFSGSGVRRMQRYYDQVSQLQMVEYSRRDKDRPRAAHGTPLKWHPSISWDRVAAACMRQLRSLDDPGFCLSCGNEAQGCEPDTRNRLCEMCGERHVFGAAELVLILDATK